MRVARQAVSFCVRVVITVTAVGIIAGPADAQQSCLVSFKMEKLTLVGRLHFTATYPSDVELVGLGAAASCVSLVRDDEPVNAFFFDDDAGSLNVELSSTGGFIGLTGLALCDLISIREPVPKDFGATVTQALDPAGAPIVPTPAVSVLEAFCPTTTTQSPTTTLAPTTTTTLPLPACGDANNDGSITVTDALAVLRAAVSAGPCPLAVCDVDGNGRVTVSDALRLLRIAVGTSDPLSCPSP